MANTYTPKKVRDELRALAEGADGDFSSRLSKSLDRLRKAVQPSEVELRANALFRHLMVSIIKAPASDYAQHDTASAYGETLIRVVPDACPAEGENGSSAAALAVLAPDDEEFAYVKSAIKAVESVGLLLGRYPTPSALHSLLFDFLGNDALSSKVEISYYYYFRKYLNEDPESRGDAPLSKTLSEPNGETTRGLDVHGHSRKKVAVTMSVDPALRELIDKAAGELGYADRSTWLSEAVSSQLSQQGFDTSPQGLAKIFENQATRAGSKTAPMRVRRTKEALPHPEKGAGSEANRIDKPMMVRMGKELRASIKEAASDDATVRKDWMVAAVNEALAQNVDFRGNSGEKVTLDQMVTLRFDPEDREKIKQAAKRFGLTNSEFVRRVASWRLEDKELAP